MQKFYIQKKMQGGYTLVELLVSLTLFTIVALAMITSLYTVNAAWKRVQSMRTVLDNLNFAVEAISRNIRTANTIICGTEDDAGAPNCALGSARSGSTVLTMNSTLGTPKTIQYRQSYVSDHYEIQKREKVSGVWSNWQSITTPEISVERLGFYVTGAAVNDSVQPAVLISLQGQAIASGQSIPFSIQTYASQRNIE